MLKIKVWCRDKTHLEDPPFLRTRIVFADNVGVMERELKGKVLHYEILEETDFHQVNVSDMRLKDRKFLENMMHGNAPHSKTTI